MRKMMIAGLCALFIGLTAFVAASAWKVKSPYEIKFENGKIHGTFEQFKAEIHFDKANPESSKFSATVDANSLGTGFFIKTSHAKEAIEAEKYPNITFVSSSVSKSGNEYEAHGNLTLKGVTKPATIHFTFEDKGTEGVFKGSFKVITKEFGITKNGSPDFLNITLNVPVTKE